MYDTETSIITNSVLLSLCRRPFVIQSLINYLTILPINTTRCTQIYDTVTYITYRIELLNLEVMFLRY